MTKVILQARHPSVELQLFRNLAPRKMLSDKEKQYFFQIEKGYEGEVHFDRLVENLDVSWLILNDLLLEQGNTFFQIDSLMITLKRIFLFEVKNLEGEFIVKGDKWETIKGKSVNNPLHQLNRAESLFNRFLQNLGFHYPVSAYVVFDNPQFTLYQAPHLPELILPTQLPIFLNDLGKIDTKFNDKQMVLGKKILSNQTSHYPNPFIPKYDYEELAKGVVCHSCLTLIKERNERLVVCPVCGQREDVESAIIRNIDEYRFLFPEKKLTTVDLLNWCKLFDSPRTVHRVLARNYKRIGHGKYSYYVDK